MLGGATHGWEGIARRLPGRTARQCRERWANYSAPSVRSDPWTEEEDRMILDKVNEVRFSWSVIARSFNGRSDNDIKNRWYSHLKCGTLHNGEKYVFAGPGAESPFRGRKRRNCAKMDPKHNAMRLTEQQRCASARWNAMHMIALLPEGEEPAEHEAEDVLDGMMLVAGADESAEFRLV
jgi:hypothetical protein